MDILNSWNAHQKLISSHTFRPFFHERDIWLCVVGHNMGVELYGKGREFLRPVIVLKKFNNKSFLALPLTSKAKKRKYKISLESSMVGKSAIVLSQIRRMDALRLKRKMGVVAKAEFKRIKSSLREMIS